MDCFALTRRRRPLVWQHEYSMGLGHVRRHARRGLSALLMRLRTRPVNPYAWILGGATMADTVLSIVQALSLHHEASGINLILVYTWGFRTNFGYTPALHTRMGEPQSGYAHQNVTSDKASQRSSYASSVNDQSSLIVMTSFESTSKADHSSVVVGTPSLAKSLQSC